jgi:hypothetical protein
MLPGPSNSFSASYDSTTKIVSAVVCVVLFVPVIAIRNVFVGCISALVLLLSYAYSPRGYIVAERCVLVRRLIGSVRISLDGIREVRAAVPDDFRRCIRLFGSGGLFGYYGLFRTSKLGVSRWYVTNRRNAVVLVTSGKTAVFSPDDVNAFLAAIRTSAQVPDAQWSEPIPGLMQPHRGGGNIGMLIGVVVGIAALALVALAMLYSPGPPNCTLTPEGLTVHDRFYPVTVKAADVDVEHVRVVDLGVDTDWRPTARTNGFANAHYRSGWFRVASGKKVRLYRANGGRLVLLPPKAGGTPVLIEVSQPDSYVKEVQQAWSKRP